jgi:hypothetical protein
MLKLIVIITKIIFFTKLCRIIIKVSHPFNIHIAYVFIFLFQFQIEDPPDMIGSRWIVLIKLR